MKSGPLRGIRVVEFAGLGPAPFACMLLADMGADVVRVDRRGSEPNPTDTIARGRETVLLDPKDEADRATLLDLLAEADVLVEGFRPGVMERLGLGPQQVAAVNARLVYARMTGWGQDGPLAHTAGHDINYIALSGALAAIGPADGQPVPPLNLVGDYGGGSLYLVTGILAALLEARTSGKGQVVDAAICDGVVSLMALAQRERQRGKFAERRGSNLFDGGAPFYAVYKTADGQDVAIGAIEPKFFAILSERVGLPAQLRNVQYDRTRWPELRSAFQEIFRARTRAEWCALLEGTDACFSPVLTMSEVPHHPHALARGLLVDVGGIEQPAPAPRFSRTPSVASPVAAQPSEACQVVARWRAKMKAEGGTRELS